MAKNFKPFEMKYVPEPNSGCWLWTSGWDRDSYGIMSGNVRANRASYEMHIGPIPYGMHVCHKCDTPPCVNPSHLFLGTNEDNTKDRHAKGRTAKGSRNGYAILSESQVIEILSLDGPCKDVAELFNVSISTISHIRTGRSWKHVNRNRHGQD